MSSTPMVETFGGHKRLRFSDPSTKLAPAKMSKCNNGKSFSLYSVFSLPEDLTESLKEFPKSADGWKVIVTKVILEPKQTFYQSFKSLPDL